MAALVLMGPRAGAAQGLFVEGGLSFARGDYAYTQQTNGGGATLGLAWSSRWLTTRVSVPYFVRDTRLLTPSGAAPAEPTEPDPDAGGYEGSVGDPLVQIDAQLVQSRDTALSVAASVKIPMVGAGYFGTGEWDFGFAASLSRFLGRTSMAGVDLAYWHLGDTPSAPLRDSVTGTVTVGRAFGSVWTASLSASAARAVVPGYEAPIWASLLVGRSFGPGSGGLTTSVGLSDGAPDFAVGLVWRAHLD